MSFPSFLSRVIERFAKSILIVILIVKLIYGRTLELTFGRLVNLLFGRGDPSITITTIARIKTNLKGDKYMLPRLWLLVLKKAKNDDLKKNQSMIFIS